MEEVNQSPEEEKVVILKSEYEELLHLAGIAEERTSFWTEALRNPEGTKVLKDFLQGIIDTALTTWGGKVQKGQLWYSTYRITVIVVLIGLIIGIATWLTSSGKLDSGAFIFLIGTIVGYLLTFLTKIERAGAL